MAGSASAFDLTDMGSLLARPTHRGSIVRDAIERGSRQLVARALMGERLIDPVARLMDASFTDVIWLYEFSRVGEEVPGNLHPKQLEALLNAARHRWLFWGNQVGKTTLGAVDLVLLCLGRHPVQKWQPPVHCWASALTWELFENILLPELLTWIPLERIVEAPQPHRKGTKRDIVIRADNGKLSRITGKAAEQGSERYQSARIHRAWLDEEHPESVWDEMQPRLIRFGGDTLATMTPLKGFTWVHGRIYEPAQTGKLPIERHWFSHAGLRDNPSISAPDLAELEEELKHNPSQLAARRDGLFVRPTGAVWPFDLKTHGRELSDDDVRALVPKCSLYGSADLGKWRFSFLLGLIESDQVLTIAAELFSQNEDSDTRAKRVHDLLTKYEVPAERITIRADNADPKAIQELNDAFDRMGSAYYIAGVEARAKIKNAGILRVESLMNRMAFRVRRSLMQGETWRLGMGAAKPGKPVEGSRFIWELSFWQYPKAEDGKVQKDEPDDATADGADACDALRYLVMTWLGPLDEPQKKRSIKEGIDLAVVQAEQLKEIWKEAREEPNDDDDEPEGGDPYGDVVQEG
ncbi:MAG TPA: terminase family protein [Gemmatimonadaceae bacterium]|nr:terminase family protein [Gemmatimonadaceae bacterium]